MFILKADCSTVFDIYGSNHLFAMLEHIESEPFQFVNRVRFRMAKGLTWIFYTFIFERDQRKSVSNEIWRIFMWTTSTVVNRFWLNGARFYFNISKHFPLMNWCRQCLKFCTYPLKRIPCQAFSNNTGAKGRTAVFPSKHTHREIAKRTQLDTQPNDIFELNLILVVLLCTCDLREKRAKMASNADPATR